MIYEITMENNHLVNLELFNLAANHCDKDEEIREK